MILGTLNYNVTDEAIKLVNSSNSRNRTKEQHLLNCIIGLEVESLYNNYFDLIKSNEFWYDSYNPVSGEKHEIKSIIGDVKWWSVHNYDYFLKNAHNIDHIALIVIIDDIAHLKFIANAKTFKNYLQVSHFTGYYYNNIKAIKNKDCFAY